LYTNIFSIENSFTRLTKLFISLSRVHPEIEKIKELTRKIPSHEELNIKAKGLENPHDNCFMNSIMQVLLHNKSLLAFFLQDIKKIRENLDLEHISFFHQNFIILSHKFFKLYHKSSNEIIAHEIKLYLEILRSIPGVDYCGTIQGDASEFLANFLDLLEEGLKVKQTYSLKKDNYSSLDWDRQKDLNYLERPASVLKKIFSFHQNEFLNREGDDNTNKYSSLYYIPLGIDAPNLQDNVGGDYHTDKPISLKEQIKSYQEAGVNARKVIIRSYPNYPIFSLNKFNFNNNTLTRYKIHTDNLKYPEIINKDEHEYRLYGIVSHYGSSFGGHYISWIRVDYTSWNKISDSSVEMKTTTEALADKDAYIFFYEKISE
jgi:ubiquitin C-terminal hydrolase